MKNQVLFVIGILLSVHVFAQSEASVTGTVTGENGKGFASATIELLKKADSSLVKVSASSDNGKFAFENIKAGYYLIAVSAVGHVKYWSAPFEVGQGSKVQVEPVVLTARSKDLKAVTISARKPLMELKIDRMVINVEAAVSNVGATALEVLEKSPGINIDKDGNISLKGKQGVQVYIDGRPSYLGGQELANMLKNMSASQLEQVEIMTNPPARYDAAGNAGIINLKTKKNKAKGFNGSATAGYSQGVYWRTNESLNMNYRNGKFNAFLNFGFNRFNHYQQLDIHRTYRKEDKTIDALFDQVAFMPKRNGNNNLKLGFDYFVNKNTTIGIVTSGFISTEKTKNFNTSYLKDANNDLDSIVNSTGVINEKWKNGTVNLNYRHQFDSTGREITADFDYSTYTANNNQVFTNISFEPNWVKKGQTDLRGDLPVDINIYSVRVDYSHPLKSGWKLESGIKSSYVDTRNIADYFNVLAGGGEQPDYSKSNRFNYKENINAAYINMNRQFKKFGVQAGLRLENTNYKGHQLGNVQRPDSAFSRSYTSLFPTVFVSYTADKNNTFGVSLGRRIDRPSYQSLNPFLFFLDNYTYEAGNPFLKPQYTTNAELSHTFKGFLTTTVNYSRTRNFFNESFEQSGYATIVRQGNFAKRENAGISMSAQIPVAKWWSAVLYANYVYDTYSGLLYGEMVDIEASNFNFNVNNQFTFGKGWSAELSGWYRTKGPEGQIILGSFGQFAAGVSKQVLKGKGSIRANIRDIFYTGVVTGDIKFQRTEAYFRNSRDTRVAGISFTYRFGKPLKDAGNQRKRNGASDEQNRVKTPN